MKLFANLFFFSFSVPAFVFSCGCSKLLFCKTEKVNPDVMNDTFRKFLVWFYGAVTDILLADLHEFDIFSKLAFL